MILFLRSYLLPCLQQSYIINSLPRSPPPKFSPRTQTLLPTLPPSAWKRWSSIFPPADSTSQNCSYLYADSWYFVWQPAHFQTIAPNNVWEWLSFGLRYPNRGHNPDWTDHRFEIFGGSGPGNRNSAFEDDRPSDYPCLDSYILK